MVRLDDGRFMPIDPQVPAEHYEGWKVRAIWIFGEVQDPADAALSFLVAKRWIHQVRPDCVHYVA